MTQLTSPVTRRVPLPLDHRAEARDKDQIAVTLYPCGDIGFRAKHSAQEYRLPLARVYQLAIMAEVEAKRRDNVAK